MQQIAQTSTSIRHLGRWSGAVAVLAAALLTVGIVPHAAAAQDLRSPDARDATRVTQEAREPSLHQDLRSPDARDSQRVVTQAPSPPAESSSEFVWGYLAIGGVALLLVIGVTAATRRRRHRLERPGVAVRG